MADHPELHTANPGFKQFWISPKTYAFTLISMFFDEFGTEGLQWSPVTWQMDIEELWGIDLPPQNFDKLCVAVNLLTSNSFFVSVPDFVRDCVVLSGHHYTPDLMIMPDAQDLAWGVTEGLLINPPDDDNENPFTPEITGFIGKVLDDEGILSPPDILRIATRDQSLMNRVHFDWGDDPELGGAIWSMERSKTDEITRIVKGRMKGLVNQLSRLPLQTGNAEKLVKKMMNSMSKDGHEELHLPE